MLKGSIGKAGAGTCPVRGHSNVQGDRTMGIWEKMNPVFRENLEREFAFKTPRRDGFNTVDAYSGDYFAELNAKIDALVADGETAFNAAVILGAGSASFEMLRSLTDKVLPPSRWTTSENVAWKIPLPAYSGSTPIISGDTIFLNVATAEGTKGNSYYGIAIGLTVLAAAYTVGGVSGAALNPAVALVLVMLDLLTTRSLWVLLMGQLLGGVAAAVAFTALRLGDVVLAVGNPFGLGHTVTAKGDRHDHRGRSHPRHP